MSLLVPGKELSRLRVRDLALLGTHFDWSEESAGFVTPSATFETVLQSLVNHDLWFDALNLLAHALAPRQAIWWANVVCFSACNSAYIELASEDTELLHRVRDWVVEPTEEKRADIYKHAMLISTRSPAHWVGMSIFWSTGNITPDAGVVTPPPPYLYARGVSAAIDLAASLSGLSRLTVYDQAVAAGVDIADGGSGESVTS